MADTHGIIRPLMTEKALSKTGGKTYAFEVKVASTKHTVKHTIEAMFGVKVGAVTTLTRKGKVKRIGRRGMLKTLSDTKIAYVTLKEGTINIEKKSK